MKEMKTSHTIAEPGYYNRIYDASTQCFTLPQNMLFVFGSNLAGRHGKGAAKIALRHFGAIYHQGSGHMGRSYALPTKDEKLRSLPLDIIADRIKDFLQFTHQHEYTYWITPVGCGLAGYLPYQIAPLFRSVHDAWLPDCWLPYVLLGD